MVLFVLAKYAYDEREKNPHLLLLLALKHANVPTFVLLLTA